MKNYYQILEISKTSDEKEIRKAYARMLKKYPPEKYPEEFKRIREAYEILGDPDSRRKYDEISQYENEINILLTVGRQAMDDGDYKKAIKEFKKILINAPSLSFVRNLLGLSLLYDEQFDAALEQFETLVKENENNAAYLYNLGITYKKLQKHEKAEVFLIRAHTIDPINTDIILELSDLYIEAEKYDRALEILRKAIEYSGSTNFQNFIYLFEMIKVYLCENNKEGCEKTLNEIEKIIPEDKEAEQFVAWKLGKLAYELFEIKVYEFAARIAKKASEIDPDNDDIKKLYKSSMKLAETYKLYCKLYDDDRIVPPLKGPIYYYLFGNQMDEEELKKNTDENLKAIVSYIEHAFTEVVKSIDILKSSYRPLYEFQKEVYDEIYKLASDNMEVDNQWTQLKDDYYILGCFKRLIALWLSDNITQYERDKYFNNYLEELEKQSCEDVLSSLDRIKSQYPLLYNLNPKYLDEIRKIVNNTINKEKAYHENQYSQSPTTNTNTTTQNNSGINSGDSSCFVATAAFGTPWAREIDILRKWRDEVLAKRVDGRLFIKFYYKVGPYAAKVVNKSKILKRCVRSIIYLTIKRFK